MTTSDTTHFMYLQEEPDTVTLMAVAKSDEAVYTGVVDCGGHKFRVVDLGMYPFGLPGNDLLTKQLEE